MTSRRALLTILLAAGLAPAAVFAQDTKPEPEDVEAIKALMMATVRAAKDRDASAFLEGCDDYVECFFADGTRVVGKRTVERTLQEFFDNRPEDLAIRLDAVPRSFRVLAPTVVTIDWPATLERAGQSRKVNTLTTVRKTDGTWHVTQYLESVPFDVEFRKAGEGRGSR